MARITTAIRARVESILNSGVDTVNADSVNTGNLSLTSPATNPFVSTANDLSDVTVHYQKKAPSSETTYTLFSDSNGPKTIKSITGIGGAWFAGSAASDGQWIIPDYDGNSVGEYPGTFGNFVGADSSGNDVVTNTISGIHYRDSFEIQWVHKGNSTAVTQVAYVLGSGPLDAAIVADEEEPYSIHQNLSKEDVASLNAPDGYQIVTDYSVSDSVDDIWASVWDASKSVFV